MKYTKVWMQLEMTRSGGRSFIFDCFALFFLNVPYGMLARKDEVE